MLGLSAAVSPGGLAVAPAMENFSIPVMIAVAVACLPVFARGWTIPRWQGALFLLYYGAYAAYLVLDAKQHAAKEEYARVMLWYVMPATAVPLLGSVVLVLRGARARSRE